MQSEMLMKIKRKSVDPIPEKVVLKMAMETTAFSDDIGNVVTPINVVRDTSKAFQGTSSAKFDGSINSYLMVANNNDFNLGSLECCIEFAASLDAISDLAWVPLNMRSVSGADGFLFYGSTTSMAFYIGNTLVLTMNSTFESGFLNHFAVTRKANDWTMWFNGNPVASVNANYTFAPCPEAIFLGKNSANNRNFHKGNSDIVRITRGHYRYDAPFVPGADW